MSTAAHTSDDDTLSEERLEAIRRQRFQARVARVVEVMRRERIDWAGIPLLTPDGRIAVRVGPVDASPPTTTGPTPGHTPGVSP